jgi:2-polyprenyl-3-methyl-5-hydroxy-6-metoxy-1,4-benzoquinol methylase
LRRDLAIQGFPVFKKDGKLLDIGCSIGNFIYKMRELGWQVKGIEPNKKAAS